MKKFLTLFTLGVLACISVMAVINWNSGQVENLALGATVTTSSKQEAAANIVDNNNGSDWQAVPATHEYTHDWVLINLGEQKTFTDIEIVWEASHCKKYSVYVSDTAIPFTSGETDGGVAYNAVDASWLQAHTPVALRGNDTEEGYTDNITLDTPATAQYVLIYADEYNNFGSQYGIRIFDVRIADIRDRDVVSELALSVSGNAVAGGEPVSVTVVPVNKVGDTMDLDAVSGLALSCDNAAVTISGGTDGVFHVSTTEPGSYTLVATAVAGEAQVSGTATLTVSFDWNGKENLATGKAVQGRVKADAEDSNPPGKCRGRRFGYLLPIQWRMGRW